MGELAGVSDTLRGEIQYGYDAEGRLLKHYEARQGHSTLHFRYDAAGNLLPDDNLPALPVTGNRLLHWQHRVMEYDTWGNLVSRRSGTGDQHYVYDAENRLIKAEGTGPEGRFTAQYHYDALGRRTRKTVTTQRGTSETRFLWQGYRLLQEQQKDRCRTYVYDPNEAYSPLARIDHLRNDSQGDICWFSTDLNGAPLDVTDEQGSICWSGQYGSFGEVRYQSDGFSRLLQATTPDPQPLRYAGQYADSETGLHYNLFRYYDPQVGRFTVQDPIGLLGGLNLYLYVPNPLTWIDPLGLMPWAWDPNGMGHHLIPRNKANSIGLTDLSTMNNTPTFFPDPYSPGMHEELHRVIKGDIGKIQGPWTGTADDLFIATSRNLDSASHIRGDLKIPATGEVLARNITPIEAHSKLLQWFNEKQMGKISGVKCG